MKRKKVGIIGCGAIGRVIGEYLAEGKISHLKLDCAYDIDPKRLDSLTNKYQIKKAKNVDDVVKRVDLVVESANVSVVRELLIKCVEHRKDVLVISIGGLLDCQDLFPKAEKVGIKILAPSGAISGIDAVKAANVGKIKRITLTTYKPPKGLEGVNYIAQRGIDLTNIHEDTEVFYGTVREAVKNFPKNINVAATVSLAAGMPKDMFVRIVASPSLKNNIHELKVEGKHGTIITRTENVPSPKNPKTSFMAVLSALRKLQDYDRSGLLIGT